MGIVGMTHVGNVRSTNEDTLLIEYEKKPQYLLVADGMGGHAAGEVASRIAAQSVKEYIEGLRTDVLSEQQILDAVEYANGQIIAEMDGNEHLKGMGTTLTFAYVEENRIIIAQVGDSSAFLYNGTTIKKITKDHTYVQHLIDSGIIKKNAENDYPFKNIITRALGMKKLEVDVYHAEWKPGDLLLLCSDGLTTYADQGTLSGVLAANRTIEEKAQAFVDYALEEGGKDNISVIIAQNSPREDSF